MPVNNNKQHRRVLILGRDIRAFLACIRSFGRAGFEVHVGMCPEDDLALKSKYVYKRHAIPDHEPSSSAWFDSVSILIRQHSFLLVVPTHDESAIPMQIYQQELAEFGPTYSLEKNAFDVAFDKIKSSELAKKLDIRLPKQATLDIKDLSTGPPDGFKLPIVIKPSSSYRSDDLGQRREVTIVSELGQLKDTVEKNIAWGEVLIQEVFRGVGTGVEVLAHCGEILAIFQHMRVHEPLGGGASSYRKSVALNPELAEAAEKLIRALNYTGVAMVEFKFNLETNDWIFIEINGRFWGSLPLALASGVDFPFYLFDMLIDGNHKRRPLGKPDVYCRNLRRDLYWNIDNLKERRSSNPSIDSVSLMTVFREIIRLITLRDHIDSFTLDDPTPGFTEFREIGSMVMAKGLSLIRRRVRNSRPIRHKNARKIQELVHSAEQILFVCSGNICRSPFAEHYAKMILPRVISVKSSGFHSRCNRPSPHQALISASKFDVDLSSHRSNTISDLLVDNSDVVLLFEEKNIERFKEHFPDAAEKVFFLGDLKPEGDYEIEDPYGGDGSRFEEIYQQITASLDTLKYQA